MALQIIFLLLEKIYFLQLLFVICLITFVKNLQ